MLNSVEILAIPMTAGYVVRIVTGRSRSLPLLTIKRREGATTAAIDRDLLLANPGHVSFHVLVSVEILPHRVFVQIGFQF